ncbi:hypothetical protein CHU92_06910 [Flavobacterium cyanobacteriorum]|uniref:Addiction module protein n=1 Tax=Flavobacterium cyanobacteriorum TaxID=2022802 RepID=A0A255Z9A2_9FLAO|nr:hypothetical protein [Flavobacterium cyanobacteriorum]OYQ38026.1 hypothetical protein CHU92_06910 [Flavobacterium cyanobacteriorum]
MQPAQLQKDKLELIEWIIQLDDETVILQLKEMMHAQEVSGFTLTEEQKRMVEESALKYTSGEERGYSWEEVKQNIAERKKLLNEKKA